MRKCLLSILSFFCTAGTILRADTSQPAAQWHAKAAFLTDQRLATLKSRLESHTEPTFSAYKLVQQEADAALNYEPVVPDKFYTLSPYKYPDKAGEVQKQTTLGRDSCGVYALALAYRMTGDEKYAAAAVRLIDAWATRLKTIEVKQSNTSLTISCAFPAFIVSADLLKHSPSFPDADQAQFRTFVRAKLVPANAMARANNWANWGTLLVITAGAYLDDEVMFQQAVKRCKELVESQVDDHGILEKEVTRSEGRMGIWYSNFCLLPATTSAEVARVNGVDLFGYTTHSGKNLRKAYEKLIPWLKNPEQFPYWKGDAKELVGVKHFPYLELLTARWPNADAIELLHGQRPTKTHFGLPNMTFTHGDLLEDR